MPHLLPQVVRKATFNMQAAYPPGLTTVKRLVYESLSGRPPQLR